MSEPYRRLLDSTIAHLEALSAQGARHVAISADTLAQLQKSPAPVRPTARPAPPAARPTPTRPSLIETPPAAPASLATMTTRPAHFSIEQKAAGLDALRRRVVPCQLCRHLASSRTQTVFGVGNPGAELMFVGEAPGADEDAQGEPFVGKAGQLLTRIIQATGLTRADVFIANILKCRPDTPGQSAGNRKPTPSEMATCLPYLLEQIDVIQPRVIVALGATAIEGLFGKTAGITRLRGTWMSYRDTPVMPTYHPAYLLRNQALTEKRKVWEDMLAVMEKLGLAITEKQRAFFLKA